MVKKTNAVFMTGVPELLVLRLLSRQEMYGYEIVKNIKLMSDEAFNLAEGVIYPLLHSLESRSYLKAKEKVVGGRNRVYYSLTKQGQKRLNHLGAEWQRVKTGLDTILLTNFVEVNHG